MKRLDPLAGLGRGRCGAASQRRPSWGWGLQGPRPLALLLHVPIPRRALCHWGRRFPLCRAGHSPRVPRGLAVFLWCHWTVTGAVPCSGQIGFGDFAGLGRRLRSRISVPGSPSLRS